MATIHLHATTTATTSPHVLESVVVITTRLGSDQS
jgi:hypothetical protein